MKANILASSSSSGSRWHCLPYLLLAIALHLTLLAWPMAWSAHAPAPAPIAELAVVIHTAPTPAAPMAAAPPPSPSKATVAQHAPVPTPRRPPTIVAAPSPEAQPLASVAPSSLPEPAHTASSSGAGASHTQGNARTPPRFDAAYLHNPAPAYPTASRRLGEEGKVLLRVRVSPEGRSVAVDIEKTSNFERLDEAARNAVQRWRFVPAHHGEEAVEGVVIVPIAFRLDG